MRRGWRRLDGWLFALLLLAALFQVLAEQVLSPFSWAIIALGAVVCGWWITAGVPVICRQRRGERSL